MFVFGAKLIIPSDNFFRAIQIIMIISNSNDSKFSLKKHAEIPIEQASTRILF